ncbi:MAG TPA: YncE family protein [Candidatus Binatia bacterium]|jgi:YVTN family beta-propeller protein
MVLVLLVLMRMLTRARLLTPLLLLVLAPSAALAGALAYVANHQDDNVLVIDTATNQVIDMIDVGNAPLGVAVDPDGAHVYVVNQDGPDGNVSIITTSDNSVVPLKVGDDPTGAAVRFPGNQVWVANRVDKTVSVIDTALNQVIKVVDVENNPLGVVINPAGTPVYVVNRGSDSVSVIDADTYGVKSVPIAGSNPTHAAVSPAGDELYVTSETGQLVTVINTASLSITGTISVGSNPDGVAFSPDGAHVYVANNNSDNVSVIDTATRTVIKTITVGDQPDDVFFTPDGAHVYVTNRNDKSISVIDAATNTLVDTDGDPTNGVTPIPTGVAPVALSDGTIPALRPPRLSKTALACQAALAAEARAFVKTDQGARSSCQSLILKDVAAGKGSQQGEALCASLSDPGSSVGKARSSARSAVLKKCGSLTPSAVNRPCNRAAVGFDKVADCVLGQHGDRVAEMIGDTFAPGDPQVLSKQGLACQATITKAASQLAQSEQSLLASCIVRILKDASASKPKPFTVSAAACQKALDPANPKASLPKLRAKLLSSIAKKCEGLTPAAIGSPCDPEAANIADVATCVLDGQSAAVERMVGAEFNDACPMLTAAGLGRAYPGVCTDH